jgi:hypothetical protein
MNGGGVLDGSQLYKNTQRESGATEANQIVAIRDAKSVRPLPVQTPSMPRIFCLLQSRFSQVVTIR